MYETTDPVESAGCSINQPSLRQNLEIQLKRHVEDAQRIRELLDLMDRNPETQRILELLGRKFS